MMETLTSLDRMTERILIKVVGQADVCELVHQEMDMDGSLPPYLWSAR